MKKKPCSKTKNVLIMASGDGSNFEAIVRYFRTKRAQDVNFELVCDKKNANVLKRAERLSVPHFYVPFENLHDFLSARAPYDLYVLAGFMRILPEKILNLAPGSFINIHPSLLPHFKGKNAILRAFEAGVKKTGVTVHFVNKNVDSGKIIAQREVSLEIQAETRAVTGMRAETSKSAARGRKSDNFNSGAFCASSFSDVAQAQKQRKTLQELEFDIHKTEHLMYPKIIENLLFKKNVLLLGSGAREHAIAAKLALSPYLNRLYLAKPNDGFKNLGEAVEFQSYEELLEKSLALNIDLLVVGPENPLCDGVADIFIRKGIPVIGPKKAWAELEGSKLFAKKFMQKNGIKTAEYRAVSRADGPEAHSCDTLDSALNYFEKVSSIPPVIKACGLAKGKGVYIPEDFSDARRAAKEFLDGKFQDASRTILLEERLFGREISIMSLWDGKTLLSFPPACDYKKLSDGDEGENTGGMGAYAPSCVTAAQKKQIKKYLQTLENALKREHADFTGVIYTGAILTSRGLYVLEYNMRFGDPEIQALLELLENDLLDIFVNAANGTLDECTLKFKRKKAYCVTIAAQGYPGNPKTGCVIKNLGCAKKYGVKVLCAGVSFAEGSCKENPCPPEFCREAKNGAGSSYAANKIAPAAARGALNKQSDDGAPMCGRGFVSSGGRVLSVVKAGRGALSDIYRVIDEIDFKDKIFRRDIGQK